MHIVDFSTTPSVAPLYPFAASVSFPVHYHFCHLLLSPGRESSPLRHRSLESPRLPPFSCSSLSPIAPIHAPYNNSHNTPPESCTPLVPVKATSAPYIQPKPAHETSYSLMQVSGAFESRTSRQCMRPILSNTCPPTRHHLTQSCTSVVPLKATTILSPTVSTPTKPNASVCSPTND